MTAWKLKSESGLPRFSLDRRITVLVLLLSAIVIGVVATSSIPVELIPSGFSSPFLAIYVPWQDAPPREVYDKITLPLEEELATVRGLDRTVGEVLAKAQFSVGNPVADPDAQLSPARQARDRRLPP